MIRNGGRGRSHQSATSAHCTDRRAIERLTFAEAFPESAAERVVVRCVRDDAAVPAVVMVWGIGKFNPS